MGRAEGPGRPDAVSALTGGQRPAGHALGYVASVDGTAWLILPTYNEAENIEAIVLAAGEALARAPCAEHRVLVVDDGSPDGTGEIADRLAAEHPWVQVLHRTHQGRHRPRLPRRLPPRAATTGRRTCWRWTATSPTTPPTCPPAAGDRGRRRPRARLALRPRRGGQRLGPVAALHQRGRLHLRAAGCSACACATSRAASSASAARCSKRSTSTACARRGTPSRWSSPTARCAPASTSSRCRSSSATAGTGTSKMSWRIAAEAMWLVPQLRHGRQPPARSAAEQNVHALR